MHRISFNEIDSTNEEVKRVFRKTGKAPLLIVSKHQTTGKGRNGRSWISPKNKGLYLSYGNLSETQKNITSRLMLISSLAVFDTIKSLINTQHYSLKIKWPNDILIDEKKICGILNEGFLWAGKIFYITGIGINITEHSESEYQKDYKDRYTYLNKYISYNLNCKDLESICIDNILRYEKKTGFQDMICRYRENLYKPDHEIRVLKNKDNSVIKGKIVNIDDEGNLLICKSPSNSIISLNSAEILHEIPLFG